MNQAEVDSILPKKYELFATQLAIDTSSVSPAPFVLAVSSDMVIRIGIVEDDTLLRTSLAQSLVGSEREIIFSVGSAKDAIRELSEVDVDVLIADIHLGSELSGADVARVAEEHNPEIGVVYLTSYEDPRLALGGAPVLLVKNSVYLVKQSIESGTELAEAIETVKNKKGSGLQEPTTPLAKLTDRQMQTLALLARGLSNKEIARIKGITEQSVAISINRISKALGVSSHLDRNQRVHLARVYLGK
ncbi:MAG: response regulator transcription factor [Pontimonas sp.]|jgi:two-component system, NarL family, nitrate/nitrite response regulator NarL|nr:response regulator transcription factor [Pontimonas sp.]